MLRRIFCYWPLTAFFASAQDPGTLPGAAHGREPLDPDHDRKLPNGRSQREEILKAEFAKTVKDAAQLAELAEELKAEIDKENRHVLSLATLRKTEEIEHLAHRMRDRMRRY